jgi:hypothetical protein
MSNSTDKWFYDDRGIVRAGLIIHLGERTPVGNADYLPAPYGKGLGRPEKKIRNIEDSDYKRPTLQDVFPDLAK